jgi:hypothetical protein
LDLRDDLLEVISITNGDGTTVTSTQYSLLPSNTTPRQRIRLKDSAVVSWYTDSSGDSVGVIAIEGVWGYHKKYSQAWLLATTANEAMDASETGYDVTSGTPFAIGNLIRFDNELGYVSAVGTNSLTITRGENASTAVTHLTGINIYIWQPMEEAHNAVCEIANNYYKRRFGETSGASPNVTAGMTSTDVPATAADFIKTCRRMT